MDSQDSNTTKAAVPGAGVPRPRFRATAVLALLLALLSLWLQRSHVLPLARASYDMSHVLAQPWNAVPDSAPVAIVYLDVASYRAENQPLGQAWNRSLHARLIRRLSAAGARAIVFDIIFSDPGSAAGDNDLIEAIRASGRVILASELNRSRRDAGENAATTQTLTLPERSIAGAAAGVGLANLAADDDFIVRRYFAGSALQGAPSLTEAAARQLQLPAASEDSWWIRYYGRAAGLPGISYSDALDPAASSDSFYRDKVIVVGARPITGGFAERRDEFRSPFPSWRRDLFMPAVEVHATQMLNRLRNDWLYRLPAGAESFILVAFAFAAVWSLVHLRPVPAVALAAAAEAAIGACIVAAFVGGRIWFPWLIVSAVQVPAALIGSIVLQSTEWRKTRRRLEDGRRAAEAKIRQQAALIDKAQDAILLLNLDGRIIYANPGATRLFGWDANAILADFVPAQLFAPCVDRVAGARAEIARAGEWQGELQLASRTGGALTVESRWTLIRDEAGHPESILLINTDVTEKKRIEAQWLRTQRLEAISSIASGMAHDLNNALAPVLMGIQRLRQNASGPEFQRLLNLMETNTNRGAEMVKQVLAFSRGQGDRRELLNPGRLLQEMERIVSQTFPKSVRVATLVPRDLWPVLGNATQLHQVLLNLCVNARDAMPQGGELTLAADNVELAPEEAAGMAGASPGPFVMLLVADTGTGIAPDLLARLGEPFVTTKPAGQGTGLGLSTSVHLVRSHGGFLNVKSEVGAGTTFEVYLPRAVSRADADGNAAGTGPLARGHGEMILLVDDEIAVRDMVRSTLEDYGYNVVSASTGVEAMSLLSQRRDVRLALVDLSMAAMDGLQTIAALRRQHPSLPAILMSGDLVRHGPAAGERPVGYLAKPFTVDQLLHAVAGQVCA